MKYYIESRHRGDEEERDITTWYETLEGAKKKADEKASGSNPHFLDIEIRDEEGYLAAKRTWSCDRPIDPLPNGSIEIEREWVKGSFEPWRDKIAVANEAFHDIESLGWSGKCLLEICMGRDSTVEDVLEELIELFRDAYVLGGLSIWSKQKRGGK